MTSERLKRLIFIKKHSPKKFNESLMSGKLVPSAPEMNKLFKKRAKTLCYKKSIRKTIVFKGVQHYAVFKCNRRISGNFETKSKARRRMNQL